MTAIPRRHQRQLNRQTTLQAVIQAGKTDTDARGPICQAKRHALIRQQASSRRVARLFGLRSPSHIADVVVAVVVDSFKRISRRARPHIGAEVCEITPSIRHANAAPTIAAIVSRSRVTTAMQHTFPNGVLACPCASTSGTVFHDGLAVQASTASRLSVTKVRSKNQCLLPALAAATPHHVSGSSGGCLDHGEPPEYLAEFDRFGISHAISSLQEMLLVRGRRALITLAGLANYPTAAPR